MHVDRNQPHRYAQIRLVGTVALHRFAPTQARERVGQLDAQRVTEHVAHHGLGQVLHVLLLDEGHLQVDLGELGLAVGAQILVAEAAGDLVVAVQPTHHQQLLEDLRALRQGIEPPWVDAAGHQVVARAFRRALGENRCLHV